MRTNHDKPNYRKSGGRFGTCRKGKITDLLNRNGGRLIDNCIWVRINVKKWFKEKLKIAN